MNLIKKLGLIVTCVILGCWFFKKINYPPENISLVVPEYGFVNDSVSCYIIATEPDREQVSYKILKKKGNTIIDSLGWTEFMEPNKKYIFELVFSDTGLYTVEGMCKDEHEEVITAPVESIYIYLTNTKPNKPTLIIESDTLNYKSVSVLATTSDSDGDSVRFKIFYGIDTMNWRDSIVTGWCKAGETLSHPGFEVDTYNVYLNFRAKAEDIKGGVSDYSNVCKVYIENKAPGAPSYLEFEELTQYFMYTNYILKVKPSARDPEGKWYKVQVIWGDNEESVSPPETLTEEVEMSHSYSDTGLFYVQAFCLDMDDISSDTVPRDTEPPCTVRIRDNYEAVIEDLSQPMGLAVESELGINTYLYVVDYAEHKIKKYNTQGNYLEDSWGEYGSGDGQFNHPWGIAVTPNNIYVTDFGNKRIQKFDKSGNYLSTIGEGILSKPRSIEVSDSLIFVIDGEVIGEGEIKVFDTSGTYLGSWTDFSGPLDLLVRNDTVWVSEQAGLEETYIWWVDKNSGERLGKITVSRDYLVTPIGLEVWDDTLICVDLFDHQVKVFHFTSTGNATLIMKWGALGGSLRQFDHPHAIKINSYTLPKLLYISDTVNGRIQVFRF